MTRVRREPSPSHRCATGTSFSRLAAGEGGLPTLALALLLAAAPAAARTLDHEREYQACMALTERNPVEAFESALAWADHGGGEAAQHCAAVALLRQGKAEPAAHRMEQIARESRGTDALVRAGLLGQAAQAWIVAGQLNRAESALTTALGLTPQDAQLLLDRGAVRGQLGRYGDAIVDLNAAIQGNPDAADAYVLRASALRQLNRLREAMTDAEQALRLDSGNPDAYFERGQIRRLANDAEGARTDFMRALTLAPNSPTGDAAQRAIEQMALAR